MQNEKPYLIIQAGGLGTRLKPLTNNIPKCLVSAGGKTLLSRFQEIFDYNIIIIADYLSDILINYVNTYLQNVVVIKAKGKGTLSGIGEALALIPENTPLAISWSDLLFTKTPIFDKNKTSIGLSNTFNCRYQYIDKKIKKETSNLSGIAGFFYFPNKSYLKDIESEGSFVSGFLQKNNFIFEEEFFLQETYEIGEIDLLNNFEKQYAKSRYFNKVKIEKDKIIKECIDDNYKELILNEINWYKNVHKIPNIFEVPQLISEQPFTLERKFGVSPSLLKTEDRRKAIFLAGNFLNKIHSYETIPADLISMKDNYINKTFDRSIKHISMIRYFNQNFLNINGKNVKNPLLDSNLNNILSNISCKHFCFIHGDLTFSNCLYENGNLYIFDPRGSFGRTKLYGDPAYDWAKLYYSSIDMYDSTNLKNFYVKYDQNKIIIEPLSREDDEFIFWRICPFSKKEIYLRLLTIWLSLIGYIQNDIDGMNYSAYKACLVYDKIINEIF